jgi:hypothetical protein
MADYVRYRAAAARLGVTMALMGLLTNLSDRIASARASGTAAHAAAGGTVGAITGPLIKLEHSLATIEHKLSSNYFSSQKINTTFLKIKSADSSFQKIDSANSEFLKIDSANSQFLKIDDANSQFLKIDDANSDFLKIDSANSDFLKIDDANSEFLKIDDANSQFLKVDSTAANSNELGGLKPDAFVQGAGSVVSSAVQVSPSNNVDNQVPLVNSPDGLLKVGVYDDSGTITLVLGNTGSTDLPAVWETNGQTTSRTLTAGEYSPLPVGSGTGQTTIQVFPAGTSTDVITLTVSIDGAGGPIAVVAQMLVGQSTS